MIALSIKILSVIGLISSVFIVIFTHELLYSDVKLYRLITINIKDVFFMPYMVLVFPFMTTKELEHHAKYFIGKRWSIKIAQWYIKFLLTKRTK
jgi:ABC-type methionine transport system permease subunit